MSISESMCVCTHVCANVHECVWHAHARTHLPYNQHPIESASLDNLLIIPWINMSNMNVYIEEGADSKRELVSVWGRGRKETHSQEAGARVSRAAVHWRPTPSKVLLAKHHTPTLL